MSEGSRTTLVIVCGLSQDAVRTVVNQREFRARGQAVIHHDLGNAAEGVVRRTLRVHGCEQETVLELARCCVSCTLREDLLPLLMELARRPSIQRIVLRLDPSLEPEEICWALEHVVLNGTVVLDHLDIEAVITAIDHQHWLEQASGDEPLDEVGAAYGLGVLDEDDRTLAQLVVGQAEFADALVLSGAAPDAWTSARTMAVLDRLAPRAARMPLAELDVPRLLARVPADSRLGAVDDAHGPLLRGQPPLHPDSGVSTVLFEQRRPFHPERLHEAIDVLLDGVVRSRGRVWLASQPDVVLWLESAGGGLRVGHAGAWLAGLGDDSWAQVDADRRAMAALRWDAEYGDRAQELVVIAHRADPEEIVTALNGALLTDEELATGWQAWLSLPDPFGYWHSDPCAEGDPERGGLGVESGNGKDDR
ncbi:MAG: cobalamin biosynthesis protein CobW [Pseudonocardiaceae bacterium]|nr:cobalamin biosynthesis protein CobW [Pseudonocardiaceae bacterium]